MPSRGAQQNCDDLYLKNSPGYRWCRATSKAFSPVSVLSSCHGSAPEHDLYRSPRIVPHLAPYIVHRRYGMHRPRRIHTLEIFAPLFEPHPLPTDPCLFCLGILQLLTVPPAAAMAPSKSKPPPSACPDAALEYHLSSVSLSYNNLEYSVVGRIAYDFRADGAAEEPELDRVQLKPLIQPESQSLSSSIELHFSGRWRAACAFLRKRDVVCVYNARVEPSRDREIHDVQLVLLDGPAATRGTRAKTSRPPASLFLLHGDGRYRRATDVVTATHLAQGRIPCERPPVAAEPPPNPQSPAPTSPAPEPPAQPAPAGRRRSSQRLQRSSLRLQERVAKRTRTGPIRTYTYRTIDSLWQEADSLPPPSGGRRSSPGGTFNAYGVVMEACAASVTARTDLRSELVLVDETSMLSTDAIPERRALMVYRFNRDSRCALPFRAVGDIVRCHRLQLNRESEEPIFSLTSNNSRGEASHTMTEGDHARVAALRNFSRTYVAGLTATHNSFLHTVSDVLHSPLGSEIFSKKFDIIARHKPAQVVGVGDTIG
eukprot:IDg12192t1